MWCAAATACGGAGDEPPSPSQPDEPAPSELQLSGTGFNDVRVGTSATAAQRAVTRVLGKPDKTRFSGCELGGPEAVFGQVEWSWGALSMSFSNRATTKKVVPGRFLGWYVRANGELPRPVRLPAGITRRSSIDDVRAATPVRSAGEGLPGTYVIEAADGVSYAFVEPYRRVMSISLNAPICE
jgi:hypothetical protein